VGSDARGAGGARGQAGVEAAPMSERVEVRAGYLPHEESWY
jgi:hypothetical protein